MKATHHSQYISKKGILTYTYRVTGTAAEVEAYKAIQETQTNRAAGTWPEADGHPLFFLAVPTLTRNGEIPQPQYNLIFNQDGTRIIRDNTAQQMAEWNRIAEKTENAKAELMAKLQLGLIERPVTRAAQFNTIAGTAPVIAFPTSTEKKDLADEIMNAVGAAANAQGEELDD
jgi:hypothetical protein